MKAEPKREASEALLRRELGARPGSLEACCCDLCGTMVVSSEASSDFLVLLAAGMDLGVRLAGLRGDKKIVQTCFVYLPRRRCVGINQRLPYA